MDIEGAIVVPEDEGTGLPEDEADWVSAGHVGGLAGHPDLSDYVATGMNFENVSDGTFDVTLGHAFISHDGPIDVQDDDGNYVNNWQGNVLFSITADRTENISYTEGEENDVFIDIDLSVNNAAVYEVLSDGTTPDEPYLKIGVIDDT